MKFRKLYWVTEEIFSDNTSRVTGVYTSIPDLLDKGLRIVSDSPGAKVRLSLVKLDCNGEPLGSWTLDNAASLEADLHQYVSGGEFREDDCKLLANRFAQHSSVTS